MALTLLLVLLGIQEGNAMIHIDLIESDAVVRVAPAPLTRYNLQSSALGKLALAQTPHLRRNVQCSRIRKELADIDAGGVAWNRDESNCGVIAMADWGVCPAATEPMVTVAWPVFRFSELQGNRVRQAIRAACRKGAVHFSMFSSGPAPRPCRNLEEQPNRQDRLNVTEVPAKDGATHGYTGTSPWASASPPGASPALASSGRSGSRPRFAAERTSGSGTLPISRLP